MTTLQEIVERVEKDLGPTDVHRLVRALERIADALEAMVAARREPTKETP
jgi:hypothetical protein